jgi:uncharacterized protein YigE (DUF2233 family)
MMKCLGAIILLVSSLRADVVEEAIESNGVKFRVVRLDPQRVQLVWKDQHGQPYRTFDRVQAELAKNGKTVKFIMNAGIFEPGGIPSGLHIENSKTIQPLNLKDAPGNFFLKPNGVCSFDGKTATINTSNDFKNFPAGVQKWALQSGPILLIHGKRHPAFIQNSSNKLHRNGVGVDAKGRLVFAMTDHDQIVNFWDFSGLFLELNCQNALFLDGDISQMLVNPEKLVRSNLFGAMFVNIE